MINLTAVRSVVVILVIATVALTQLGCAQKDDNKQVVVGSILGLTGDYASYGVAMKKGLEFAISEAAQDTTLQRIQPKLIIEDSQFDPGKAVAGYQKLIGIDGAKIIVGITGSRNAIPIREAARDDSIIIIDALSSAPKLSEIPSANYFRIMASDAMAGIFNVQWALEDSAKRPAVLYVEDDWGTSYRNAVLTSLREQGLTDVRDIGITAGTRDFRSQIEILKAVEPDVLFLLVYAKEGSIFMQQLRQAGLKTAVYGSDNISSGEFMEAGPDVIEGVRVALPAPSQSQRFADFQTRFAAKYNEQPDANVIKSYDAMMMALQLIKDVGYNPKKIQDRLKSASFVYHGISGEIRFGKNGDLAIQQYAKMIYRDGKLGAM